MEELVKIGEEHDKFMFSVECTGSVAPLTVVAKAIDALLNILEVAVSDL